MPRTDTSSPDYYHKVVDCQWACPAHTNVPEYIRLISQRRYSEAYLLNRHSNVFPGILGRVCDRPCEPACRRGRLEGEEPVAICRLKRVTSDYKKDIRPYLPKAPAQKQNKKIALIGCGPASLTVANDLMPLGYQCTIFEKEPKSGGAMRYSVPLFRLPETTLDEEINYILDMGVDVRFNSPVTSLKQVLGEYDAVFIGSGAPVGRDLPIPGRDEAGENVQVGLSWLASVAFGHVKKVGRRVVVIGGGNTAMDCCRTALRLGGQDVKVIAPEGFAEMLASPWEKEDAQEEGVEFKNNLLPQAFVMENGKFKGVLFDPLKRCYDENKRWAPEKTGALPVLVECDMVILAIGQNNAFPYIETDSGVTFDKNGKPAVDEVTLQSKCDKVFFGGDAAFGPKNIIWAVAHGHEAALSIDLFLSGKDLRIRPPRQGLLASQKMGVHEWIYDNAVSDDHRYKVPHLGKGERLQNLKSEVELGFDEALALKEAARCLNCDVQTVFSESACIECDACLDICPTDCLSMTTDGSLEEIKAQLKAPALDATQQLYVSATLQQSKRVMVKDENLCVHCGLCAERCPTGAWDMQKFTLQLPRAGEQ